MSLTSRERVLTVLNHQKPDRVPIHDSPWETAIHRWRSEGLPEKMDPADYFQYEFKGMGFDSSFQFEEKVVEETEEYKVVRSRNGVLVKNWKHQTSTPGLDEFTITDRRVWEANKERLRWNDSRVNWEQDLQLHRRFREQGYCVSFGSGVGYDQTQGFVGSERLLVAMLEDPDWVKDMFATIAELTITAAEEMLGKGFQPDTAWLYDDMGYRNASLFSPGAYRELSFPYHKRMCDFFHGRGLKVILHSCGCVMELIPQLIEAGFDCLQPLEVKAGMDLFKIKKQFGDKLALMGGIDVRNMAHPDPKVVEEEIKTKFACAKSDGAYLYHSDHSVPDNVSFQQYQHVIDCVLKYGKY